MLTTFRTIIAMMIAIMCIGLFVIATAVEIDYLKSLDDLLLYKISFKSSSEEANFHAVDEDTKKWITIMSADQEEYHCLLPTIHFDPKKRIDSYSGPSPAELLQPLSDEKHCSYRIETYWMYEFCHGRYILQYHEEKDTKIRTEFVLGNYAKATAEEAAKFDQLNPPTRKFEENVLPYYSVTYTHGTTCDLTNKPRQTVVQYVCDESSKGIFQSLAEISSCSYEIVIKTNRLCAHPSFQPTTNSEYDINCFATNSKQLDPKPRAQLRNPSNILKEFTTVRTLDNTKNLFTRLLQEQDADVSVDRLDTIIDAIKASAKQLIVGEEALMSPLNTPTVDGDEKRLIEMFWNGKTCFNGGTGWWKYEVCHGRSVVQYHKNPENERTQILLGVFHKEVHKLWAAENPHKARSISDGKVYQISNLYTKGDICPETGTHRNVEVRIRCKEDVSSSRVFLYLVEATTCSYVLFIESPLFCEYIQKADNYGVMPNTPDLNDFTIIKDTKEVSTNLNSEKEVYRGEELSTILKSNPHVPEHTPEEYFTSVKEIAAYIKVLQKIRKYINEEDVQKIQNIEEIEDVLIKVINNKNDEERQEKKLQKPEQTDFDSHGEATDEKRNDNSIVERSPTGITEKTKESALTGNAPTSVEKTAFITNERMTNAKDNKKINSHSTENSKVETANGITRDEF